MNNKEFDDIIKKRLESLSTEGSDDAWDLFKEKWDHESTSDNSMDAAEVDRDLDAKIKEDMQKLRVPFNSQHWIKLKEQLELEALFKKKLFVAKSLELVILALIVVGILNLWPIQNDIYQIPVYDIPMVVAVPVDKATAEKHAEQETANTSHLVFSNQNNRTREKLVAHNNSNSDLGTGNTKNSGDRVPQSSDNSDITDDAASPSLLSPMNDRVSLIPFITNGQIFKNKAENYGIDPVTTNQSPIAVLETQNPELLVAPERMVLPPVGAMIGPVNTAKSHTFFSFALGPKMNLVNSPFDPVYGFDPYNTIHTNFNVAATISKEIGPAEIYAGLGYTNTSYEPRLVDEIYESGRSEFNVTRLENIEFKTFNIPLGVRWKVLESKIFELYASTGLDVNLIAESVFEIQDAPVGIPPSASKPPSKNEINNNSKLSTKEFNDGLLSGGKLSDNFYAAASVGLGFNFKFVERAGFFIEPRYSHFISSQGIGPNEDRVHALSVDLGLKYRLN